MASVEIGDGAAATFEVEGAVRSGVTRLVTGGGRRMPDHKYLAFCLAGEPAEKHAGVFTEPPCSDDRESFDKVVKLVAPPWAHDVVRRPKHQNAERELGEGYDGW